MNIAGVFALIVILAATSASSLVVALLKERSFFERQVGQIGNRLLRADKEWHEVERSLRCDLGVSLVSFHADKDADRWPTIHLREGLRGTARTIFLNAVSAGFVLVGGWSQVANSRRL
jgi:hypothetical protein